MRAPAKVRKFFEFLLFRSWRVLTIHVGAADRDRFVGPVPDGLNHKRSLDYDSCHVSFGSTPTVEGVHSRQQRDAQILCELEESQRSQL